MPNQAAGARVTFPENSPPLSFPFLEENARFRSSETLMMGAKFTAHYSMM